MSDSTGAALATIGLILALMAVLAVVEIVIPLHDRNRWNGVHLVPNLALTFLTFATNLGFNAAIIAGLVWLQNLGLGLLNTYPLAPRRSAGQP